MLNYMFSMRVVEPVNLYSLGKIFILNKNLSFALKNLSFEQKNLSFALN
jgi:hypothetical protein